MGDLLPMPRAGDVFADARGEGRMMRVSWHREAGVVVVSLWAGRVCRASFQLPAGEVSDLIAALTPIASGAPPQAGGGGPADEAATAILPIFADQGGPAEDTTQTEPEPTTGDVAAAAPVTQASTARPTSPPPAWPPVAGRPPAARPADVG